MNGHANASGSRRGLHLALEIGVPVVLVGVWWAASAGSESFFFPPLPEILSALRDDWLSTRLTADLVPSLVRLAIGYAIAVAAGVAGGLVLGLAPKLARAFGPVLEFFRFVPPPVMAPVFIIVAGFGDPTKILFIAFGVVWPVLMNTMDGVAGADRVQSEVARAYGFTAAFRVRHVVLPAAMPRVFTGLRTGLAVGVIVMAVGEMVGSSDGVGYAVLDAQRGFAIPEMWAGMIMLGIVGYVLNLLLLLAERRVLFWYRDARETSGKESAR
ncbi:ABC transporter permease [Actinomadura sp. 1N219]|uniref:ABC transporter permease n=1 Tax=Actinomadura sp. 1N219 TaxID=3375152 RepID=UPI0037A0E0EC